MKATACMVPGLEASRRVRSLAARGPAGKYPEGDGAEHALIHRVRAGDEDAFAILFQRHAPAVHRQAVRMLHNTEEADDVVQEVFCAFYEKAHTFRGASAFSTWLYRLTVHAAISRLRRQQRRREIPLEVYMPRWQESGLPLGLPGMSQAPALDEGLARAEMQRLLLEAMEQLRPLDKAVVVLKDLEGLTHRDIGAALDLSVSAVKARLHRARRFLRGRLAGDPGHTRL